VAAREAASQRAEVASQLQRAVGDLTKTSLARVERETGWFAELPAEHRARIGMVLQAGYNSFIAWFCDPERPPPPLTTQVFGNAPRSFAGVITLQQTVAMIRLSIEVAETELVEAVDPPYAGAVREALLVYGRELAFASADVYARAAEMRGAWDARLEALVVDSVMRGDADESVRTRASALGWDSAADVAVVVGRAPAPDSVLAVTGTLEEVRRVGRSGGHEILSAVQGDRLVLVVGDVSDPDKTAAAVADRFGPGPVVIGPVVPDLLQAHHSAAEAVAGLRAAVGWPASAGPVTSDDLLAERALDGDQLARRRLAQDVYRPLARAQGSLLETVTAFLDQGGSIEGTSRVLFVHANTVRYRLRRVVDLTGLSPTEARQAFTLRIAVVLGRLAEDRSSNEPGL